MKILFAFYPLYVKYNYGVALLSALCKARGIDVALCVLDSLEGFISQLERERPDVVGFSCVTVHDYRACLPFIHAAKGAGCLVALGGVWAGLYKPVDQAVDFVCRGDGESLPDFLLHGDTSLFDAPKICRDIHCLPLADYELFECFPFERGLPYLTGKKVLPYQSSRGCNGVCSFCQVRHQPRGVRVRAKVKEDLTRLADTYAPDLFFMGDAGLPYANEAWKRSWEDFSHPFFAYIRADIEPCDLTWLISRGMQACAFGVESGDEAHRNQVLKKRLTDDQLARTLGILERHQVASTAFFMTGTPGETPRTRSKTLAMARSMPGSIVFYYEGLAA